ncbi:hypothetical protein [uncultured Tateyamaria sp.]|uniref:hypothetical protein n=1 Tax=uncultured Tateyamaria sp. TaxID=455651 RepID=UPI00260BE616|nr:hypothetical protein [uncultured Tateyamaria sp.]
MITPLQTITRIASGILNEPAETLDIDLPVVDLRLDDDEWRDMMEEAAEIHDVPIIDIINTAPIYRIKRGDMAMASLSDFAAFSPRASAMLAEFTTQLHLDTLRSCAASIEAGRYVASGLRSDDMHRPKAPVTVIAKGVGIWGAAIGLPLINAFGPCNPICRNCFAPPATKFWEIAVYSLPLAIGVFALWLGPGLYEIWDDVRKQTKRSKTRSGNAGGPEHMTGRLIPEPE